MEIRFIWTTADETFTWRYRVSVESVFFHHPTAQVRIYSNTLRAEHFQECLGAGFDLEIRPYRLEEVVADTPVQAWLKAADLWRHGPHYYSHLTELLRFALLYKFGGVYLDTDVIVLNPIDGLRNTLGIEEARPDGTPEMLNCAVLAFEPAHPFLRHCLEEFSSSYRMERWAWNGPQLVTRVHRWSGEGVSLQGIERFYPIHWRDIARYFRSDDPEHQEAVWQRLRRDSLTLHYWNKATCELTPRPGSLMSRAFAEFRPFPQSTDGPDVPRPGERRSAGRNA